MMFIDSGRELIYDNTCIHRTRYYDTIVCLVWVASVSNERSRARYYNCMNVIETNFV